MKSDISDTKGVITSLSRYFEGKSNLTIDALLATVYQLEKDRDTMNATIEIQTNNANIANKNSDILISNIQDLQNKFENQQKQLNILSTYIFSR